MKPMKNVFLSKFKLSLSFALLYLVDLFIKKLKTKFKSPFYRMILNKKEFTTLFEEMSPQELNKSLRMS